MAFLQQNDDFDFEEASQKNSKSIERWRNAGILPKNKVSGSYYYRWEDIQTLVRKLNDKGKK